MSVSHTNNINSAQSTVWPSVPRHLILLSSTPELDQIGTTYQYTGDLDSTLDDPNLGQFGNYELSGPLPGGYGMYLDPTTALAANVADQPPAFNINIGTVLTPSMNNGFNPSISSHMATHQHQSGTGIHFLTSDPSQNNFEAPPLSNHEIYANQAGLADLVRQNRSSNAVRNSQSNIPPSGTWPVDGE